jgi:hypothetical protein
MAGELLRISVNQIGLESAEASLKRGEAGQGPWRDPPQTLQVRDPTGFDRK